jgi:hypothetical protein
VKKIPTEKHEKKDQNDEYPNKAAIQAAAYGMSHEVHLLFNGY